VTKKNLTINQGTDYSQTFWAGTNSSGKIVVTDNQQSTPLNLTGYTANSQFRKHYTSNTATLLGVTFGARANGEFALSLSRIVSANTIAQRYVYDVEMTDSANTRIRILEGEVTITPEVTKI